MTRLAITFNSGYLSGMQSVLAGVMAASRNLGCHVIGVRDGFEGLLFPERYPDSGLMPLDDQTTSISLGTGHRANPFRVRTVVEDQVTEVDRSNDLLQRLRENEIDTLILVCGRDDLSTALKLHRAGVKLVTIPQSVENDVATTMLSFGFNSALSCATEMIERAKEAAVSARRIGVVEVLGRHAGWLALQAGLAACADAVLIPEIPYDLDKVADAIRTKSNGHSAHGLIVVAEGAEPAHSLEPDRAENTLRSSLAPSSTGAAGANVIERSGLAAKIVARELQRRCDCETYPVVLGAMLKGGHPTAVDRQLGVAYGAAAVEAAKHGESGVMTAFVPPELLFVPLADAVNRIRTVPQNSVFLRTARSLGICLGD